MCVVPRHADGKAAKRCAEKFPQQEVPRRRLRTITLNSKLIIILCERCDNIRCNKWWGVNTVGIGLIELLQHHDYYTMHTKYVYKPG